MVGALFVLHVVHIHAMGEKLQLMSKKNTFICIIGFNVLSLRQTIKNDIMKEPQIGEFEETKLAKTSEEISKYVLDRGFLCINDGAKVEGFLQALGYYIHPQDIRPWNVRENGLTLESFSEWFYEYKDESGAELDVQVELQLDPELRSDLAGLARYVAAEIEQDDCALRERIVSSFNASNWEYDSDTDFLRFVDKVFNYIKTGKHE